MPQIKTKIMTILVPKEVLVKYYVNEIDGIKHLVHTVESAPTFPSLREEKLTLTKGVNEQVIAHLKKLGEI